MENNSWIFLDSSVTEPFSERSYQVAFPVYGLPASFWRSVSSEESSELQPDQIKKQFEAQALRSVKAETLDSLLETFLASTAIGRDKRHKLAKVTEGEYEFRRGTVGYGPTVIHQRIRKLISGDLVEIGYPSTRVTLSGEVVRSTRTYVGEFEKLIDNATISLTLGSGDRRNFRIARLNWLELIPWTFGRGVFHHEFLLVDFARLEGRPRVGMRVSVVNRPKIQSQPEAVNDGFSDPRSEGMRATFSELQKVLESSMDAYQLRGDPELRGLQDYLKRTLAGYTELEPIWKGDDARSEPFS